MTELFMVFFVFGVLANLVVKSSIFLGSSMAWCSFIVALNFVNNSGTSWYGIIFFLMFISGLLVLMMYVLSIDFKTFFLIQNFFFLGFFFLVTMSFSYSVFSFSFVKKMKTSKKLFSTEETNFILFMGSFLFFVLWIVIKIMKKKQNNFRPFF